MGNVMKIPAKPQVGNRAAKKEIKKLRVAAYCRVSTDTEEQATSYEAQIQHYREYIISKPEWEFVDIKSDISQSDRNGYLIGFPVILSLYCGQYVSVDIIQFSCLLIFTFLLFSKPQCFSQFIGISNTSYTCLHFILSFID